MARWFLLSLVIVPALSEAACAFRISYRMKDDTESSKVYRPKTVTTSAACEARAKSHCGLANGVDTTSQAIRWTFSDEPDVSRWTPLLCGQATKPKG